MRRSKSAVQRFTVLVLVCVLLLPVIIHAQIPSEIIINYPELVDADGALQLGLYFTVTDGTGRVVTNADIQSAQILLDNGERNDNATVERPTTPFYIVLVLDASGSMGGAAEDMRQAAIKAVEDAPEEALFAVIRFNQEITVLQDFTDDRNRAINAIGEVQSVNLSGTCLYDATFRAIETVNQAPPGRRAIILFTDGRDELADGSVCSTHTKDQVVQFAQQRSSRVPIHTIGLSSSDQRINAAELRDMASLTGGFSAIGTQQELSNLFQQIMDALKSQWLAKALFYPSAGQHTATLTVFLGDGTRVVAVTTFDVPPPGYAPPVVATITPTPVLIDVDVLSVTRDSAQDVIYLEVVVQGQEEISEFRFDFFNAETNELLDRHTLPSPLSVPVSLPAGKLEGDIRVEVRALNRSGQIIAWPGERDRTEDKAVYEFAVIRPTPTPPPASATPVPVTTEINSISYNPATDMIALDLSLTGQDQMGNLKINFNDASTGTLAKSENVSPSASVEMSADGLEANREYDIQVITQNPTGQDLHRSKEKSYLYQPPQTPTPTASPPPTFTPTPEPLQLNLSLSIDDSTREFVFGIEASDPDRIGSFRLQLRGENGIVIQEYERTPPPYDAIRIPIGTLGDGTYIARLRAYGAGETLQAETTLGFEYHPPATPTPAPTPTLVPTATPTPEPGFTQRVGDTVRDNPILGVVVAVIGLALILVLFTLIRPRRKAATGTGFLSAQTGFFQAMPPAPDAPQGGEHGTVVTADPEKTDIFPQALPPLATLRFEQSGNGSRDGEVVPVTHFPFKIGRGSSEKNDLRLDEDTSVSRRHATITYENAAFLIADENSANGTALDGKRLAPQTPMALHDGAQIMIGKGTVLIFESARDDSDPDKTDYIFNTSR